MNLFPLEMPVDSFCMGRFLKNAEGGEVYVCTKGTPADQMKNEANFLTVYREEQGENVPVQQPIILNQVGLPVVDGEVVSILCPQEYSLAVYDAYGTQQFYFPNVLKYDPDQFEQRFTDELSSNTGAGMVGTTSGKTVQQEINDINKSISDIPQRCSYAANLLADGNTLIIECFGDSTMWGSIPGATTSQDPKNSPSELQFTLDLLFPGLVEVRNKAIPGTTLKKLLNGSDGGQGTFEERISSSDALVIYCNHCLNDCNSYQSDEKEYKDNLYNWVNIVRKYNKIPVIVTPSIISPTDDGKEYQQKRMPAFIQAQRDVAAEMNVDLVDNFYYSLKTSRMIPANKINGDGVHLTDSAYQNAGWNMAIPLVLPNKLINNYDLCGLSTTQYYDNIKNSRAIWDVENRFGSVLTGDSLPEKQIINFPLLLDSPTDHSTLSICGFTSEAGGISNITYFGKSDDLRYSGKINYKISSGLKHDQVFNSEKCFLSAGFHIIGIESSNEIGRGNFNFAGVQLLPKPSNA